MHYVSPFIMKTRVDATNYFTGSVDVEAAEEYIRRKRESGMPEFSMMHVFLASFVRLYSQHPDMNRFIRGQRIYARNGIEVSITIKKEMKLNAADTVAKLYFDPTHTADDVYHIVNDAIKEAQSETSDFDDVARVLSRVPRILMKAAVWGLNLMDYFGLLPKSLEKVSPFHGSMVITSLGSLGIPPIYHHLYNFGNIPLFFAFGKKYVKYELQKDGSVKKLRLIDYRITCDERIADGYSYSVALRYLNHLMRNPELLDSPPEKVVEDIP